MVEAARKEIRRREQAVVPEQRHDLQREREERRAIHEPEQPENDEAREPVAVQPTALPATTSAPITRRSIHLRRASAAAVDLTAAKRDPPDPHMGERPVEAADEPRA